MKTRKEAANEIYSLQKSLEARPFSYKTVYNRVYNNNGSWRFIGRGYDYTA